MTREMILEALAHCVKNDCGDFCPMKGKDWINRGLAACEAFAEGETVEMPVKLIEHVIKLLKEMEPRVMTVEELCRARGKPAWLEPRNSRGRPYTGWVLIYDVQDGMGITGTRVGVTEPGHVTIWPAVELYGSKWRCWTSEPTEEQRRATPWGE